MNSFCSESISVCTRWWFAEFMKTAGIWRCNLGPIIRKFVTQHSAHKYWPIRVIKRCSTKAHKFGFNLNQLLLPERGIRNLSPSETGCCVQRYVNCWTFQVLLDNSSDGATCTMTSGLQLKSDIEVCQSCLFISIHTNLHSFWRNSAVCQSRLHGLSAEVHKPPDSWRTPLWRTLITHPLNLTLWMPEVDLASDKTNIKIYPVVPLFIAHFWKAEHVQQPAYR
jgi:hypothetical protein